MARKLSTNLTTIRTNSNKSIQKSTGLTNKNNMMVAKYLSHTYASILLPYQLEFMTDSNRVLLIDKSRQIGFSWTMALYAIFSALQGYNVYYNSYNDRSGKLYITIVTKYIRAINEAIAKYGFPPIVSRLDMTANTIKFNNLCKITALTSDETNFRGISGNKTIVILDEVAFKDNLPEKLKAVLGLLVWGGKILIASTQNGTGNEFNKLCAAVRKGEKPYSYHQLPIDKAIDQGLVKKICNKTNVQWTKDYEKQWLDEQIEFYGDSANEELFCIPSDEAKGKRIILEQNFQFVEPETIHKVSFYVRYWDFASSISANSYYTASVKLGYVPETRDIVIMSYTLDKQRPLDTIELVKNIVELDGGNTTNVLEKEPGSSGEFFVEMMVNQHLVGYAVDSYQPKMKKHIRLFPVGQMLKTGKLKMIKANWNKEFIDWVSDFDGTPKPGTNDLCDCLSGGIDYLTTYGIQ